MLLLQCPKRLGLLADKLKKNSNISRIQGLKPCLNNRIVCLVQKKRVPDVKHKLKQNIRGIIFS